MNWLMRAVHGLRIDTKEPNKNQFQPVTRNLLKRSGNPFLGQPETN